MYNIGETQKNWVTLQNGQRLHLKYYPQLKKKEDVEVEGIWSVTPRKSIANKGKIVMQI